MARSNVALNFGKLHAENEKLADNGPFRLDTGLTGGGFKDVKYWNVQDDLPADKRALNVAKVRGWIEAASAEGMETIVVTNVLTQSGIMGRLQNDVAGTGAKFNDTGLMQNPRFADWIVAAVEENL